jgi:hypothetical protein
VDAEGINSLVGCTKEDRETPGTKTLSPSASSLNLVIMHPDKRTETLSRPRKILIIILCF